MQNLVNATNAELAKDPKLDISLTLASLPVDKYGNKFWGSGTDHSTDATQIFAQLKKPRSLTRWPLTLGVITTQQSAIIQL